MPNIRLVPVQSNDDEEDEDENDEGDGKTYTCPLFQNSERSGDENFIIDLELPTDQPSEHWILTGTALLCQKPIELG